MSFYTFHLSDIVLSLPLLTYGVVSYRRVSRLYKEGQWK